MGHLISEEGKGGLKLIYISNQSHILLYVSACKCWSLEKIARAAMDLDNNYVVSNMGETLYKSHPALYTLHTISSAVARMKLLNLLTLLVAPAFLLAQPNPQTVTGSTNAHDPSICKDNHGTYWLFSE
jgi:hypothetical protein